MICQNYSKCLVTCQSVSCVKDYQKSSKESALNMYLSTAVLCDGLSFNLIVTTRAIMVLSIFLLGFGERWAPVIPETLTERSALHYIFPCHFYWIGGSTDIEPIPIPPGSLLTSVLVTYRNYIHNDSGIKKMKTLCLKLQIWSNSHFVCNVEASPWSLKIRYTNPVYHAVASIWPLSTWYNNHGFLSAMLLLLFNHWV